jgi:hypothetical protein
VEKFLELLPTNNTQIMALMSEAQAFDRYLEIGYGARLGKKYLEKAGKGVFASKPIFVLLHLHHFHDLEIDLQAKLLICNYPGSHYSPKDFSIYYDSIVSEIEKKIIEDYRFDIVVESSKNKSNMFATRRFFGKNCKKFENESRYSTHKETSRCAILGLLA